MTTLQATQRLQTSPFAQPWEISFTHIFDAMEKGGNVPEFQ